MSDDAFETLESDGVLTNKRDIMAVASSLSSGVLGTKSKPTDKGKGKELPELSQRLGARQTDHSLYLHVKEESIDDSQSDVSVGQNDEAGEKIVIERIHPKPPMFRDCTVVSVRDFERLAKSLHRALQPEKSPEHVFRVLYFLLREPEAIKKLEEEFGKRYDKNLKAALTERFGEGTPQQRFAFWLIGEEDAGTDQTMNRWPPSEEEYTALSERLHDALLKKDCEAVYRVLTPFQRNTELLYRFSKWYRAYKRGLDSSLPASLQADMKQHLEGNDLNFGLFLIGDEAMETKVVSLSEAERLSKMVLQLTFERKDGIRVPVPYETGSSGSECLYKAHIAAESLTELGYGVKKIFIQFLRTNEQGQKDAGFVDSNGEWSWHVACCMWVRTNSGTELRILDPASSPDEPTLWTLEEWLRRPSYESVSFKGITFEEWEKLVTKERKEQPSEAPYDMQSYPADQAYVFTTNRNYLSIPGLDHINAASKPTDIPNELNNRSYRKGGGVERINKSTTWVPYYKITKAINKEIQAPTINNDNDAENFLNNITSKFEAGLTEFHLTKCPSTQFSNRFSNAYTAFVAHLQEKGVSSEIVTEFKTYLSSDENE
ncbi:MAG TPA: protein-glutamine glutaminase family protein [Ktedonobacteraceae bacterium]